MSKVIDDFEIFREECSAEFPEEMIPSMQESINESLQDWEWVRYNGNTPADFVFGALNKTPIR